MTNKDKIEARLIGKIFGKLTVIAFDSYVKGHKTKWLCQCECGNEKAIRNDSLVRGDTITCGCRDQKLEKNVGWKGVGKLSATKVNKIKHDALKRKLVFNVTIDYLWKLYEKQEGKCALTGLPLIFPSTTKTKFEGTASLDRIHSSEGYVPGNVQWVHRDINTMKWNFTTSRLFEMAKLIVTHNKL